jgi:hypothetical protein
VAIERTRLMPHYKIRKNRVTGEWELQWRSNEPIPHLTFKQALATLAELTGYETHWRDRAWRIARRRFDEP